MTSKVSFVAIMLHLCSNVVKLNQVRTSDSHVVLSRLGDDNNAVVLKLESLMTDERQGQASGDLTERNQVGDPSHSRMRVKTELQTSLKHREIVLHGALSFSDKPPH